MMCLILLCRPDTVTVTVAVAIVLAPKSFAVAVKVVVLLRTPVDAEPAAPGKVPIPWSSVTEAALPKFQQSMLVPPGGTEVGLATRGATVTVAVAVAL